MDKEELFNIHRSKWLNSGELEEKLIQPHLEKHRKLDAMLPQASFFYAVVNYTTYEYDFLGKNQCLLTGFDNDQVQKEGVHFQMTRIFPEDGKLVLAHAYDPFHKIISRHRKDPQNLVLQSNYRFRHKEGHLIHLLERVWPLSLDDTGNPLLALIQINELPDLQPFRMNISMKKLLNDNTYSSIYSASFPPVHVEELSPREMEILKLIAQGCSSKVISEKMCVSYHTIRTHRRNMLRKLGLNSSNELVAYAFTHNLV